MSTNTTLITIREAARRLGVHENTVRRYADRGLIRAVRLPSGVRRLRREDIEALDSEGNSPGPPFAARAAERASVTVDELVAAAGARPVSDLATLARPDLWDSDEEVERFIATTLAERERDR